MVQQRYELKKTGKIRVRYICRTCNTENQKRYYHSLTGDKKAKYIERANKWNKTHDNH